MSINTVNYDLLTTARTGDDIGLKRLLETGCEMDVPNKNGDTALNLASWNGHSPCVKLLFGFEVSSRNT